MNTFLRQAKEYYGMLDTFDDLYKRSQENNLKGVDLLSIITSRNNILLAYRTIKANTGSKTKGTDGMTIDDYKITTEESFVEEIQKHFSNYKLQLDCKQLKELNTYRKKCNLEIIKE